MSETMHYLACWLGLLLLTLPLSSCETNQQLNSHLTSRRAGSSGYTLEAEADRVDFLPGGPAQLDFGLFSG